MAQHSNPARLSAKARPATSQPAAGLRAWSRGRQIYLAVGILACLAGIMIIAFSR